MGIFPGTILTVEETKVLTKTACLIIENKI